MEKLLLPLYARLSFDISKTIRFIDEQSTFLSLSVGCSHTTLCEFIEFKKENGRKKEDIRIEQIESNPFVRNKESRLVAWAQVEMRAAFFLD